MFNNLIQVGLVTEEIKRILASYINIFNIGPWYVLKFGPENVSPMTVYGKEQKYESNITVCPIGDVRFEYIEPITESAFSDFYSSYKENVIHHLKLGVKDYHEALDFFASKEINIIQTGHQLGDKGKNIYNFLDTKKDFGFITEIVNVTPDFIKPPPDKWVPSENQEFKPVFIKPSAVGIVVRNLEDKINRYMDFGVGPWKIQEFGKADGLKFKSKMAFYRLDNAVLKLVEPLSDSIFLEHLTKFGEGIHHLKMEVDDYESTMYYLANKGIEAIYSENYMDEMKFSFMNTKKSLNFVIEISDKKIKFDTEGDDLIHP